MKFKICETLSVFFIKHARNKLIYTYINVNTYIFEGKKKLMREFLMGKITFYDSNKKNVRKLDTAMSRVKQNTLHMFFCLFTILQLVF